MSTLKVNTIQDTTGNDALTIDSSGNVTASQGFVPSTQLSHRNLIINGAQVIDQRNSGASVTINGNAVYVTDRFVCEDDTDGAYTAQQDSSAPSGFKNSLKLTVTTADASLAASQYARFDHRIEGYNTANLDWGSANAKTVTLSFWVRSSLTGTFGGAVFNNDLNRSYPYTYTISSADTWEQKTIIIPGDTSGTWLTTNGRGMYISWGLGVGSTRSGTANTWSGSLFFSATGATNVLGTNGATFYITGVQLEVGSVATPFEHRSYGEELARCQRYFLAYHPLNETTATIGLGYMYANNYVRMPCRYPVEMRTTPTLSVANSTNAFISIPDNITFDTFSLSGNTNSRVATIFKNSLSGGTAKQSTEINSNSTSAYIHFDAEL